MDVVKVNLTHRVYGYTEMKTVKMYEDGDSLIAVFEDAENYKLNEGQHLVFKRYIYTDDDNYDFIESYCRVEKLAEVMYEGERMNAAYLTKPLKPLLTLGPSTIQEIEIEDEVKQYGEDSIEPIMIDGKEYFVLRFDEKHNIFPQDVYTASKISNGQYEMNILDEHRNIIGRLTIVGIPFALLNQIVESGDCCTYQVEETCGKYNASGYPYNVKYYKYVFSPSTFSRDKVVVALKNGTTRSALYRGVYFEPRFNPFYYYYIENGRKKCAFWGDPWWSSFKYKNNVIPRTEIWTNDGDSKSSLYRDTTFWNVPISFERDENMTSLGTETEQSGAYIEHLIESVIPDVVDMERVKYTPVTDEDCNLVTGITFNFHFRQRKGGDNLREVKIINPDGKTKKETIFYGRKFYAESGDTGRNDWFVDTDNDDALWNPSSDASYWGGSPKELDESRKGQSVDDLIQRDESDLMGYLGFMDSDIHFRKNKVSKSFIRLSFYTSTDPVSQKLLYYSTSFLDSTGLYGKYIKQMQLRDDLGLGDDYPIVFMSATTKNSRVDSRITLTNEYDSTKSSEGFNLYLFNSDTGLKDGDEKSFRTIYMKVEFNHAGYGKTIPMILYPNGKLTIDNFIENLYIPVRIGYINGRYVYYFPKTDETDRRNGGLRFEDDGRGIVLTLFEPKLESDEQDGTD